MKVDPCASSGLNSFLRALKAKSAVDLARPKKLSSSDFLITGTIKLSSGSATATH